MSALLPGTVAIFRPIEKHGNSFTTIFEHLPAVTKKYVPRVMGYYAEYRQSRQGAGKIETKEAKTKA